MPDQVVIQRNRHGRQNENQGQKGKQGDAGYDLRHFSQFDHGHQDAHHENFHHTPGLYTVNKPKDQRQSEGCPVDSQGQQNVEQADHLEQGSQDGGKKDQDRDGLHVLQVELLDAGNQGGLADLGTDSQRQERKAVGQDEQGEAGQNKCQGTVEAVAFVLV